MGYFILSVLLGASIARCCILYCQREDLAASNAEKDFENVVLRYELKKTLALVARFTPRPTGTWGDMVVSDCGGDHVSVESMEK